MAAVYPAEAPGGRGKVGTTRPLENPPVAPQSFARRYRPKKLSFSGASSGSRVKESTLHKTYLPLYSDEIVLAPMIRTVFVLSTLVGFGSPHAISADVRSTSSVSADKEWEMISKQMLSSDNQSPGKSAERIRQQNVEAKLRQFYHQNPGHPKAATARKLELVIGLQRAKMGAADISEVIVRANALRLDKSIPTSDRYDIALAVENTEHWRRARAARSTPVRTFVEQEQLADELYLEFGAIPQVCGLYAGLVLRASPSQAQRLSNKLVALNVPDSLKQTAAQFAEGAVSGSPLELTLETIDGGTVRFDAANEITVAYLWNAASLSELKDAHRYAAKAEKVKWVYISMGQPQAHTAELLAATPIPGQHCMDQSSLNGAAATAFAAQTTPWVAVIGKNGRLIGQGPAEELPTLLTRAKR